jgi:ribosome maturation factor RimP
MIESIELLIKPTIESHGLKLIEILLTVEHGEKFLRIALEKPGGTLLLDDIVLMTQRLSPILDESPLIQERYILDITSPGAERPIDLDRLTDYLDSYICLTLQNTKHVQDVILGTLTAVDEETIQMKIRVKTASKPITILRKDLKKASTAIRI